MRVFTHSLGLRVYVFAWRGLFFIKLLAVYLWIHPVIYSLGHLLIHASERSRGLGPRGQRGGTGGPQGTGRSAGRRASGRIGAPGCGGLCPKVLALALAFLGAHEATGQVRGSSAGRVRAPRTPLPCPSACRSPSRPASWRTNAQEVAQGAYTLLPGACRGLPCAGRGASHVACRDAFHVCTLWCRLCECAAAARACARPAWGRVCVAPLPPTPPSPRRALRRGHEKETMNSFL